MVQVSMLSVLDLAVCSDTVVCLANLPTQSSTSAQGPQLISPLSREPWPDDIHFPGCPSQITSTFPGGLSPNYAVTAHYDCMLSNSHKGNNGKGVFSGRNLRHSIIGTGHLDVGLPQQIIDIYGPVKKAYCTRPQFSTSMSIRVLILYLQYNCCDSQAWLD